MKTIPMSSHPDSARVRRLPRAALLPEDPLYKHVKSQIVQSLTAGEWKPGEVLPSEARLAARYGVGISTIRAAIGELVAAGIVVRRQGKGTFVAIHGEPLGVYRFFHVVRNGGDRVLPVSELISLTRGHADDEAAELLELPRSRRNSEVFNIRNVLRISDTPVVVSDIVVPVSLFPGLNKKTLREGGRTIYAVYQRHFGVTITKTIEELRSARADSVAAKFFGIRAREPVLEVRRIAYTFNGLAVEVRRSQIDTRHHHYRIEQGDDV